MRGFVFAMRLIKSLLALSYRLVANHGPIPRYPCLYWFFRKRINNVISRLWRTDAPTALPDSKTELLIASPGHCASHSLCQYITEHNPDRNVLLSTHAPAPVLFALKHNIPCIVLTKDFFSYIASSYRSVNPTGFHNPILFYKMLIPHTDSLLIAKYEDLILDPALIVGELNRKFGLNLNEGDNVLPKIRTYSIINKDP